MSRGRRGCAVQVGASWGWCAAAAIACSGAPKPKAEPAAVRAPPSVLVAAPREPDVAAQPPEPEALPLRTGAIAPVELAPLTLAVSTRGEADGFEILKIRLPQTPTESDPSAERAPWTQSLGWSGCEVELTDGASGLAFVAEEPPAQPAPTARSRRAEPLERSPPLPLAAPTALWVRRRKSAEAPSGAFYCPSVATLPGHRVPFHSAFAPKPSAGPTLGRDLLSALASYFEQRSDPFSRFAAGRLRARANPGRAPKPAAPSASYDSQSELASLMDTLTGRASIQAALERDRALYLDVARQKRTVPIDRVEPPRLDVHPWPALRKALPDATPPEPLAELTPAEFYFVRVREFAQFLDFLSVAEDFGEPAADVLDGNVHERGTYARYATELALERNGLTPLFGPQVVADLALIGSDPYIHEGSDVTLLMRVKESAPLEAALAASLGKFAAAHGGLQSSTFVEDGVTVTVERSGDGRVRRQRAMLGDVELVSNSPGAIKRVIATAHGKHPPLASEPDFDYMLARDAGAPDDLFAYMGDRFIASVVGPKQKIAEARRQLALLELSTPGYLALLSGFLDGHGPSSREELLKSKLMAPKDLLHADGSPIEWQPGEPARSRWGTSAALEPLLDLPEVERVSDSELRSYSRFASEYRQVWAENLDPVALRASETKRSGQARISAELRILPLLRARYSEVDALVGSARLLVPRLGTAGARLVLAFGKQAALRHELSDLSDIAAGGKKLSFDWLGDYALLGVLSRNELVNAARDLLWSELSPPISAPLDTSNLDARALADFPIYVAIGLASRVGALVALGALRELAREAAPGVAEWSDAKPYRNQQIVRVAVHESDLSLAMYYTVTERAMVFALNEVALHAAIDQVLEAPPVTADPRRPEPGSSQLSFELGADKSSALYRVLGWLAAAKSGYRSTNAWLADAVFRGAPELRADPERARALMQSYFGTVPLTDDGKAFEFGPGGVRDPLRGSPYAPIWPDQPVPGSPVDRVLTRLGYLRAGLSFDTEPALSGARLLRSLHARLELELR